MHRTERWCTARIRVDFYSGNRSYSRALSRIASLNNARERGNKRIMTKAKERKKKREKERTRENERKRDWNSRARSCGGEIDRAFRSQHARQIYIATTGLSVAFGKTARYFMARSAGLVTFVDVELSLTSSRIVRNGGLARVFSMIGEKPRVHKTRKIFNCIF